MSKPEALIGWIVFLLSANTGVILTLLRERIYFGKLRGEVGRFLPDGYDPNRLEYPYILDAFTPRAWREALRQHCEQFPSHPARQRWLLFRRLRHWLMWAEIAAVLAFAAWLVLS
jgi:hypothetical protein